MNINPKLVITDEDIEVNPELWVQKISVILFNDTNGKNYWNKFYKFIPWHKRYNEAIKWVRNTKFHEYSCRITGNANNDIEIVTQNLFGDQRVLIDQERELIGKIKSKIFEQARPVVVQKVKKIFSIALKCDTYQDFVDFFDEEEINLPGPREEEERDDDEEQLESRVKRTIAEKISEELNELAWVDERKKKKMTIKILFLLILLAPTWQFCEENKSILFKIGNILVITACMLEFELKNVF